MKTYRERIRIRKCGLTNKKCMNNEQIYICYIRWEDVCDQDVCDPDVCDPDIYDLDVCDHLFVTKTFVTRTFVTILRMDVCDQELKFWITIYIFVLYIYPRTMQMFIGQFFNQNLNFGGLGRQGALSRVWEHLVTRSPLTLIKEEVDPCSRNT